MFETMPHPHWRTLVSIAVVLMTIGAISCGSNTSNGEGAMATGTAQTRASAVARFTAEAVMTVRPEPTVVPTEIPDGSLAGPSGTVVLDDRQAADREAIDALLLRRSEAFSLGEIDDWYETCDPSVRESGRGSGALARQYAAIRFEPSPESNIQFVAEQVLFSGGSSATVLWGLKIGEEYVPGLGGGPFVKVDGEWFSRGWGCVG